MMGDDSVNQDFRRGAEKHADDHSIEGIEGAVQQVVVRGIVLAQGERDLKGVPLVHVVRDLDVSERGHHVVTRRQGDCLSHKEYEANAQKAR
jgi:hypothetical protein